VCCVVHYIISTTAQKLRVNEIHNTYHANEKMFWDWTPDYPCGLASPTLLQVAVCCLDGVTTIVITKIILMCGLQLWQVLRELLNQWLSVSQGSTPFHNYSTSWLSSSQEDLLYYLTK